MQKNGISPEWVRTCAQACSYQTPVICNNEATRLPNNLEKIIEVINQAESIAICEQACNGSDLVTQFVTASFDGNYTQKNAIKTGFWLASALDALNQLSCPQKAPIPVPIPIHEAVTQPVTVERSNWFSEYFPKANSFSLPSFSLPRLSNNEKRLTPIRSGNFVAATGGMLALALIIGLLILV